MIGLSPVASIDETHDLGQFSCGTHELDDWLRRYALANHNLDATKTFVTCEPKAIVRGYYSLAASSIEFENTPPRIKKGLGRYPVPAILLARLAVDSTVQGQRVGESLLLDALRRAARATDEIGAVAVLVHALDQARDFYLKYDFEPLPSSSNHLVMAMKDIKATLAKGGVVSEG